ncbi:MAG: hypothetical protein R3213_07625, partial [Flavobacteriaceae bacterium]|nr:hypothetical protein [Flavobacteriaceae bacterium]
WLGMSHWSENLKFNKMQFLEEKDFKENPDSVKWREMKKAAAGNPINMDNYQNMGGVTHHETTEAVIEEMISKQEQARGMKIDQEDPKQENKPAGFGGIKDDRKDRKFFKIYTGN